MCGRYALGIRASFIRYQLQQQGMAVDEAPEDDEARETYNFPPGSYGLVYRADVPDHGVRNDNEAAPSDDAPQDALEDAPEDAADDAPAPADALAPDAGAEPPTGAEEPLAGSKSFKYQIKVMKWGLIPFWTKRSPDYGSMLRTINCRDDSLIENRGMWTTMKAKKRCLVIAQGFYEWLKKPNSKDKIPHFVKRKDGNLMCFAGLWDCVKYEDAEDKLYTYTIITTDSNKQLSFLHDRMPVILDPGSDAMSLWLDPTKNKWSKELQSLLKPYTGELECYPVSKDVGKVGNNSPNFIVPIDSKENKKNIANFFGNAQKKREEKALQETKLEDEGESEEKRDMADHEGTEDNAPPPVSASKGTKRQLDDQPDDVKPSKITKYTPPSKATPAKNLSSPSKHVSSKKARSATSNKDATIKTSPSKKVEPGTQRITAFFGK